MVVVYILTYLNNAPLTKKITCNYRPVLEQALYIPLAQACSRSFQPDKSHPCNYDIIFYIYQP